MFWGNLQKLIIFYFLSTCLNFGDVLYRNNKSHLCNIHHILLRKGFSQKQSVLLLFTFALVLELLAFLSIYADDQLAALSILVIIPLGAVSMRFLGYGSIISTSRKQKVLETIQQDSSDRILFVEQWCTQVRSG